MVRALEREVPLLIYLPVAVLVRGTVTRTDTGRLFHADRLAIAQRWFCPRCNTQYRTKSCILGEQRLSSQLRYEPA